MRHVRCRKRLITSSSASSSHSHSGLFNDSLLLAELRCLATQWPQRSLTGALLLLFEHDGNDSANDDKEFTCDLATFELLPSSLLLLCVGTKERNETKERLKSQHAEERGCSSALWLVHRRLL